MRTVRPGTERIHPAKVCRRPFLCELVSVFAQYYATIYVQHGGVSWLEVLLYASLTGLAPRPVPKYV
eukprot:1677891-Pyramimonas_sp.AAC.1